MAEITRTITVGPDLRPCNIEIYNKKQPGLFHKWVEVDEVKNKDVVKSVYALVETKDGSVFRVRPNYIRFLDSDAKFADYNWEDNNDKS